jgi:hypothetical protein
MPVTAPFDNVVAKFRGDATSECSTCQFPVTYCAAAED